MRKIFLILIASLIYISAFSQVKVRGYYRKDGTYVQPHIRSSPNKTKTDNYSYLGNTNPYTGKTTGTSSGSQVGIYSLPPRAHNLTTSIPSYIPEDKKDYLYNEKGKWGYSYNLQVNEKYKISIIYTLDGNKLFTSHEWKNGDVYIYNNDGYQIDYFNLSEIK